MSKISHPVYYNSHPSGIECIDIAEHYNFCIGNVIKYLWRAGLKTEEGMSDLDKEIEDCQKAKWYLQRHITSLINKKSNGEAHSHRSDGDIMEESLEFGQRDGRPCQ